MIKHLDKALIASLLAIICVGSVVGLFAVEEPAYTVEFSEHSEWRVPEICLETNTTNLLNTTQQMFYEGERQILTQVNMLFMGQSEITNVSGEPKLEFPLIEFASITWKWAGFFLRSLVSWQVAYEWYDGLHTVDLTLDMMFQLNNAWKDSITLPLNITAYGVTVAWTFRSYESKIITRHPWQYTVLVFVFFWSIIAVMIAIWIYATVYIVFHRRQQTTNNDG